MSYELVDAREHLKYFELFMLKTSVDLVVHSKFWKANASGPIREI